jgi:predicted MPP superfamily phosphohydrolase
MLVAHGITLAAHAVPTVGAMVVLEPTTAVVAGIAAFLLTTLRLANLIRETKKNRWITRLVDEPVLAHWCASILATLLFLVVSPAVVLAFALGIHAVPPGTSMVWTALLVYSLSAVLCGWGVTVRRRWVRTSLVEIPIAGLAEELDGYRIVQLSDLHIGNFDTRARGFKWAHHANRLDPDLVAVTGDLVTLGTRFYEDVGDVLGELRAKDGVFVSMGNHDQWDPDTFCRVIESKGPRVLRNEHRIVRRGRAELVVAGLDDWSTDRDDLERTLAARPEGAPTVLLSHYPEFFEEAARRDVDLVLSGHTHGGQIGVPFSAGRMTLSRFARQHAPGLHERGRSRLYVHAGLGTTGPPMRLGVAPEIAVFVLRRA